MKNHVPTVTFLACASVAAVLFATMPEARSEDPPAAEAAKPGTYWYLVDQDQGEDLAGWSDATPAQIADRLHAGRYVNLQDYRTADINGNWSGPSGRLGKNNGIWIKPALVRSFRLIDGDPKR